MKIDNEFTVGAPVERAWTALTDLERLAPCLPGAQLTGVEPGPDGEVYSGKVKVKVGPVISQFAGTARFVECVEDDRHAVVGAKGKDARGGGSASAVIDMRLRPDGDERTAVSVHTDLSITGRLAQFGSGMIKEISEKLLQQFVRNLEEELGAREEPEPTPEREPAPAPAAAGAADAEVTAHPESAPSPVPEPPPTAAPEPPSAQQEGTTGAVRGPVEGTPAGPVAARPGSAEADPVPASPASAEAAASSSRTAPPGPRTGTRTGARTDGEEAEALDLMGLAGASVYKRLIPVAVGVLVIIAVIILVVAL